jgi:hypothetical protein
MMSTAGRLAAAAILLGLFCLACGMGAAEEKPVVGRGHWAYQAIDGWAKRGLLAGYPAGRFAGPESLTCFEVASLALRAVEGIGQEYQRQGKRLKELAEPSGPSEVSSAPTSGEIEAIERGPGVYAEDLAMLEKLVAEFRSELAALGTRVDELEALLASTRAQLAEVESEVRRHKISGYIQFRFSDDEAASASTFSVRRARLSVSGPLSEKSAYKIQMQLEGDSGDKVALRDAYIDLAVGEGSRLRAGQAKLPVGYEVPESSSVRLEPERSRVMDRLFPEQRDIGVQWRIQRRADAPAFDLAVVNGTGINVSDDNDRKDVIVSVQAPFSGGSICLSAYEGRTGRGSSAQARDRFAAGLEIGKEKMQLRGEYVMGRDLGEEVTGWYARLSRRMTQSGTLFVKYDTFDEDRDDGDDLFRRWCLGWVEEIDEQVRLTLAWEKRQAGSGFSEYDDYHGEAATLQLQAKF